MIAGSAHRNLEGDIVDQLDSLMIPCPLQHLIRNAWSSVRWSNELIFVYLVSGFVTRFEALFVLIKHVLPWGLVS